MEYLKSGQDIVIFSKRREKKLEKYKKIIKNNIISRSLVESKMLAFNNLANKNTSYTNI
jgi:hypothetical protein